MRCCVLMLVAALACSGCTVSVSTESDAAFDSGAARAALETALASWRDGKAAGLARRTPPIRFVDDDLRAGLKLVAFEMPPADAQIRPFEDVVVTLTLRRGAGPETVRKVSYQVSLTPRLAVLRADK